MDSEEAVGKRDLVQRARDDILAAAQKGTPDLAADDGLLDQHL